MLCDLRSWELTYTVTRALLNIIFLVPLWDMLVPVLKQILKKYIDSDLLVLLGDFLANIPDVGNHLPTNQAASHHEMPPSGLAPGSLALQCWFCIGSLHCLCHTMDAQCVPLCRQDIMDNKNHWFPLSKAIFLGGPVALGGSSHEDLILMKPWRFRCDVNVWGIHTRCIDLGKWNRDLKPPDGSEVPKLWCFFRWNNTLLQQNPLNFRFRSYLGKFAQHLYNNKVNILVVFLETG